MIYVVYVATPNGTGDSDVPNGEPRFHYIYLGALHILPLPEYISHHPCLGFAWALNSAHLHIVL